MEKAPKQVCSKPKILKVKNALFKDAINWPGHCGGALSLGSKKLMNHKPVELFLHSNWPGMLFIKHNGALAVTRGQYLCELEDDDSKVE